jgi:hypothetical protein
MVPEMPVPQDFRGLLHSVRVNQSDGVGSSPRHVVRAVVALTASGDDSVECWSNVNGDWIVEVVYAGCPTEGVPFPSPDSVSDATGHIFPSGQVPGVDESE